MALPIDELAAYAEAQGIGSLATKSLVTFGLQATPDAQVALIEYPGGQSEQAYGSDEIAWESPRFQVICRAAARDRRAAAQKAEDAYRAFGKIGAETLSGTFYHSASCQRPFFLGLDDNERPMFAFNVQLEKDRSA